MDLLVCLENIRDWAVNRGISLKRRDNFANLEIKAADAVTESSDSDEEVEELEIEEVEPSVLHLGSIFGRQKLTQIAPDHPEGPCIRDLLPHLHLAFPLTNREGEAEEDSDDSEDDAACDDFEATPKIYRVAPK